MNVFILRRHFRLTTGRVPRAKLSGAQIIYGCEVKHFNLPCFALQVQSVGETDVFLRCFIHEIGVSLGTTASCVRLQRKIMKNLPEDESVINENSRLYEEDRLVVDGLNMQTD
ncbi:hypothetical protein Y032_0018g3505 [Ancylostoma ceylanicum]|uniref:Pseudouridine synthase II N-terminal domain-containing protein n=1 Tax=Ancylostoma ceylanicum TaxID=53326 RepID=A0A016V406_9BILA|nr:hypothetical protein Y032_0018g3505 [Ancylostoma ceylanicum]